MTVMTGDGDGEMLVMTGDGYGDGDKSAVDNNGNRYSWETEEQARETLQNYTEKYEELMETTNSGLVNGVLMTFPQALEHWKKYWKEKCPHNDDDDDDNDDDDYYDSYDDEMAAFNEYFKDLKGFLAFWDEVSEYKTIMEGMNYVLYSEYN